MTFQQLRGTPQSHQKSQIYLSSTPGTFNQAQTASPPPWEILVLCIWVSGASGGELLGSFYCLLSFPTTHTGDPQWLNVHLILCILHIVCKDHNIISIHEDWDPKCSYIYACAWIVQFLCDVINKNWEQSRWEGVPLTDSRLHIKPFRNSIIHLNTTSGFLINHLDAVMYCV